MVEKPGLSSSRVVGHLHALTLAVHFDVSVKLGYAYE
jgi:hypothetical protein